MVTTREKDQFAISATTVVLIVPQAFGFDPI
jgi:hypothetical protein